MNAIHHPTKHAGIFTETRPDELPLFIFKKPVDAEDNGKLANLASHIDPVLPVVGHVVTSKREHSEGVVAQLANGTLSSSGLLGYHRGAEENPVLPVFRFDNQGRTGRTAATENNRV